MLNAIPDISQTLHIPSTIPSRSNSCQTLHYRPGHIIFLPPYSPPLLEMLLAPILFQRVTVHCSANPTLVQSLFLTRNPLYAFTYVLPRLLFFALTEYMVPHMYCTLVT